MMIPEKRDAWSVGSMVDWTDASLVAVKVVRKDGSLVDVLSEKKVALMVATKVVDSVALWDIYERGKGRLIGCIDIYQERKGRETDR